MQNAQHQYLPTIINHVILSRSRMKKKEVFPTWDTESIKHAR